MTISEAETQYAENADWHKSREKAEAALVALRVMRVLRGQNKAHNGSSLSYQEIGVEIGRIEDFLGVSGAIAAGAGSAGAASMRSGFRPMRAKVR